MARRTLRALDKRIKKKIIEQSLHYSINDISTKTVARSLKISEPTIYIHFKNKSNLLREAYLFAKEEVEKEENKLFSAYKESEKKESDLTSFLLALISLEKVSKETFLYKLKYEREVLPSHEEAVHADIFAYLSEKKENEEIFLFLLPFYQIEACSHSLPQGIEKTLLDIL